jgi:tetratricopeptide (TPR) repeat protein
LAELVQAAFDREPLEQLDRELSVFAGLSPILRGRLLQLRGQFDRRDNQPGATEFLMDCRPPEEAISQLTSDEDVREQLVKLNIIPDDGDLEHLQQVIESRVALIRRMKQDATHWLGLIAYENGNYRAAINFFDKLTLAQDDSGPWANGARYNLARAHEMLARQTGDRSDLERALELYREDNSPQRLGNLIRARRLAEDFANTAKP